MIVVAGGSGLLGRDVVARLVQRGLPVRVLGRDIENGRTALGAVAGRVELVAGDVREPASLRPGLAGADLVIDAVQGFGGRAAGGLRAVDLEGNQNLITEAARAGVTRFILLSIHDATASDPLPLARAKAAAEAALERTAMRPTIVRPTAYMETWAGVVGDPILASGKGLVFGRGRNPINFVAAADVAAIVEAAVVDEPAQGDATRIEVVGPEDLTFDEVVGLFGAALGRSIPTRHVPLAAMRVMALALRPFNRVLADQIAAGVILDTADRTATGPAAASPACRVGTTTFADVIRAAVARSRTVAPTMTT